MRILFICLSVALLGGCTTIVRLEGEQCVPVGHGLEPVEAVQVMNTNWLLLSFIPIASGNPDLPNRCSCRWFTNTVTLQNQIDMLEAEARRIGAKKAVRVTTGISKERAFFFLLVREKMHTSAILVKEAVHPLGEVDR